MKASIVWDTCSITNNHEGTNKEGHYARLIIEDDRLENHNSWVTVQNMAVTCGCYIDEITPKILYEMANIINKANGHSLIEVDLPK